MRLSCYAAVITGSVVLISSQAQSFELDAGEDITIEFPLDTVKLNAKVTLDEDEYTKVLEKSTGVKTGSVTAAQCPILSSYRYPNSIDFEFYIPELRTKRIPLVISSKPVASIEKYTVQEADSLNTAVLSVTGFKNNMGFQGGFYFRQQELYPYMSSWSIEVVLCMIEQLEKSHPVEFSGWYIWGHSAAGQFAHKFAFYQELSSSGVNIPKKVRASWSSAPGHPYLAGYNDIAVRHRQRHQYHYHEVGTKDSRLESVTQFANIQNALPSFYGKVTIGIRKGGTHTPAPHRLNIPNIYENFGRVMKLNDDHNPCFIRWEYLPAESDVASSTARHPEIEDGDTASPQVRVFTSGTFTFKVTSYDGIDDSNTKTDKVRLHVKAGNEDPKPVLSVIVLKASASQDADSPGIFEIRSSRPMDAKEFLDLKFEVKGRRFVTFNEQLFGTKVIDYAGGDWSNIRYVYQPKSNIANRMRPGTQSFFVMVHGSNARRSGYAKLSLEQSDEYAIDSNFRYAKINIKKYDTRATKVVPTLGDLVPVTIDSGTFGTSGRTFRITREPTLGTVELSADNIGGTEFFPMVTYKHDNLANCEDNFSYEVREGRRRVAAGKVWLEPSPGSGRRCIGASIKPCNSRWSKRSCNRKRTRLNGKNVYYCTYDTTAKECRNIVP